MNIIIIFNILWYSNDKRGTMLEVENGSEFENKILKQALHTKKIKEFLNIYRERLAISVCVCANRVQNTLNGTNVI
jgi:hypothetical protein